MGTGPGDKPVSWGLLSSALGTAGASGGRGVTPGFSFCVLRGDRAQPHREHSVGVSCQEEPPHPEPPDDPPSPVLRPPTGLPRVWAPPPRFRGDSGGPLMAQGEGRSSPASPRPAEGGANVGGCGPRLKALRAVGSSWLPRPDPPAPHQDRPPQPFLRFPFAPSLAPATGLHALGTLWEAAASAPCSSGQS